MEIEEVMQVAAQLTATELEGISGVTEADYPATLNKDGTVTVTPSPAAIQRKWIVWETFRTYYWFLIKDLGDPADWPPPPSQPGQASVSGTLGALSPLITALGGPAGLAALVPQIIQDFSPVKPSANAPSLPPLGGK